MSNPLSNADTWSLVANGYQSDTMPVFKQYCKRAIELAGIGENDKILDVACGPGTLALELHDRVKEVFAIDFSPEMIKLLDGSIQNSEIQNVKTSQMDGQDLKINDEEYDRAFSMFGLIFFPDRHKGFSEIHRVLKPGGKVIISSWAEGGESSPLMNLVNGALKEAFPDMPAMKTNLKGLENPDQFRQEMHEAGFCDVFIEECFGYWEVRNIEEFLKSIIRGSAPIILMKQNYDEKQWQEKFDIMLSYLNQKIEHLPQEYGSKAYIGVGVKK